MSSGERLSIGIVTCSYAGDLQPAQVLCESIDRFVPDDFRHLLVVPKSDLKLFAGLTGARREVVVAETVQPSFLRTVPMPGPKWRERLHLPRREVLFSMRGLPIRGWLVQQLRKLAIAHDAPWDVIVHVDSDNVFFRPLTYDRLVQEGAVRLYRNPGHADMLPHNRWHRAAAGLLGLPEQNYFGADYINPLVVWRRDVTQGLARRIEEACGSDWMVTLSRTPHFAEYILYGVYADHVLGGDAGHFRTAESLSFSRWVGSFEGQADEEAFVRQMEDHHVLCNLQSTIGMTLKQREVIFDRLVTLASETAGS
ncbi:MAG: hypothetical protein IPJ14_13960 [Kineosporiaceae bacterium]|nr:hypothetical protein [Kineosporiaceae bacterium]MBK7623728.1 hypothetical protein [Kineosporiaceae bacterium]MBK8075713.1 hypothetical protein [Kineosporiaceae bacterium]